MNTEEWKARIKLACEQSGTYHAAFDSMIETLADIMSLRDRALEELISSGEQSVVMKTSDRGAQNLAQNPRLQVVMDLNRTALPYWKELLLRPQAKGIRVDSRRTLADILTELEETE